MNNGKPDSFDDLDAITMIRDDSGGWNLFANGKSIQTLTWPSLFPDPMEAIINLAGMLDLNSQNPKLAEKTRAEDFDAQRGIGMNLETASADGETLHEATTEAAARKPSPKKRASRPAQEKPQSRARRKR